jgi:hypothetical protein
MQLKRRDALFTALFGAGALGLRAIATGLPAWFIANPRKATAADLCAVTDTSGMQYLIASVSANGDPINCNCPGTYETTDAVHPTDATMVNTPVSLGGKSYGAAAPWAGLSAAVLGRTSFFHHVTRSIVHGDQPKVLRLMGDTSNGEMIVSAYARHLGPCLGTVQNEPVAVGAGSNASELLSYGGRGLPSVSPTQLRQLLTGAGASGGFHGGSGQSPLVALRATRDMYLDQLYDMAKSDGTGIQKAFIDALALSQTQVRALADTLHDTLSKINGDDVAGQSLAAAALISAKVTPVVTMHIPFGGDNHNDSNLAAEVAQTVSGVAAITTLMGNLSSMSLTDQVTFATLNVFGRNLNGIAKVTSMQGRDHYGNHNVCVMIGKNVKPGVIGGVTPGSGGLVASDIDSATGGAVTGGDIPKDQTHAALARTLGVALGIPTATVDSDLVATAGGKVVPAALNTVV